MTGYIKAEMLKRKNSFGNKLLIGLPFIALGLSLCIINVSYAYGTAYNWWYTLFLPFLFLYVISSAVKSDQKWNFHNLLAVAVDKKRVWYAKIAVSTLHLFLANMFFSVILILFQIAIPSDISINSQLPAALLLTVTLAWQIPVFMLLTEKAGLFASLFIGIFCNIGCSVFLSETEFWWIPFAIPSRLMCVMLRVRPNGLFLDSSDALTGSWCLVPGILITVALYVLFSYGTARIFEKKEV